MNVKNFSIKKTLNLSSDLINLFIDYCCVLDDYFKKDENKKEHNDLYLEYTFLNSNLKKVLLKNGVDV